APNAGPYRTLLRMNVSIGMAAVYLESTRAGIARFGHKAWFYYLLQAHRHCLASDPRNKIYALLGIAWKERPPFSTHPGVIVPDYEPSVREVYTKVAKTMLLSRKDLRYLSHVFQESELTDPYWINAPKVESMRYGEHFLPIRTTNQHPAPTSCGNIFFEYMIRALARIFDFEERVQAHETSEPLREKRWQRLIRLWQGVLELEPEGSPFSFENFEDLFIAEIERQASPRPDIGYRDLFSDFKRELRYSGNPRCLFRTVRGYVGIGALSLRTDDEIWILGGVDTPVILRKQVNGSYRSIGETYVHGIMHGEAIWSTAQEQLQQISLQ
ncbi:MAG: hypothetical protein Q9180_007456, partial [Flavoplaca navasiana]